MGSRGIEERRDLLGATARDRLVSAATQPSPSAPPRTVGRVRAVLRQAIALLVALASIG